MTKISDFFKNINRNSENYNLKFGSIAYKRRLEEFGIQYKDTRSISNDFGKFILNFSENITKTKGVPIYGKSFIKSEEYKDIVSSLVYCLMKHLHKVNDIYNLFQVFSTLANNIFIVHRNNIEKNSYYSSLQNLDLDYLNFVEEDNIESLILKKDSIIEDTIKAKNILEQLPENEMLVLTMYYLDRMNYSDIAIALKCDMKTLSQILKSARKSLLEIKRGTYIY
jgi:RNA polymerase sigma factor (sigma-70 family)